MQRGPVRDMGRVRWVRVAGVQAYDLNHQKYRIRSEFRLAQDTYGILQMTRPFGSDNGGTYFGIKQVF